MDKVDRYLERVQHLPPASAVVTQLLGLFGDPNRDTDRLAELIGCDPSLTGEVLKRCNSAFFRWTEPASDVFEAVRRLGYYEAHDAVAGLVGAHAVSPRKLEDGVDGEGFWRHSVVAAAAAALTSRFQEAEGRAFTAGLLHDVGKLVFATVDGAVYAGVLRHAGGVWSCVGAGRGGSFWNDSPGDWRAVAGSMGITGGHCSGRAAPS